uniref:Pyridoxamine 5'-phosphate oxidase N-terminal domain-containing protein n=1 Tax=Thermosporothrix sp. COM3 TaxID=2490863 RepID=A0A455SD96_9CHLR|nr:hypothetical protein KTC_02010 [Thermosporothrix sp. COM3]
MNAFYHEGEIAVQQRAGVYDRAQRMGQGIWSIMPPALQLFLLGLPMVVLGATDPRGKVWASVLFGTPGFLQPLSEHILDMAAFPDSADPLYERFARGSVFEIGLLAIDLSTRRRIRINGVAQGVERRHVLMETQQVYGNCRKHIQVRELEQVYDVSKQEVYRSSSLSAAQERWITSTDTFFIATAHPERGADASHRGGNPGFVHVPDASTLIFPDYAGNMMFQTLGNITTNPATGLLLIDFEQGHTLQLTGKAHIIWDERHVAAFPGAERLVVFSLEEVIEKRNAFPYRAYEVSYSPFNPLLDER